MDSGTPASGNYDIKFSLFGESQNGSPIGPILTNLDTAVSTGLFSATLDFGAVFSGSNFWLEIAVRTNGNGSYTTLAPRQEISPVPYAVFSASASNAVLALTADSAATAVSVPASGITGTIAATSLPSSVMTNGQQDVFLEGVFSGDGSGLTNLSPSSMSSVENTNHNTFFGLESGASITNGQPNNYGQLNSAFGWGSGFNMSLAQANTIMGAQASYMLSSGSHNTALGHSALYQNVSGSFNTAIGAGTLELYTGSNNTAVGFLAMYQATGGPANTAIGEETLLWLTNGGYNTALGQQALGAVPDGSYNIALGYAAGFNLANGNNNIYIGNWGSANDNGMIYLGTQGVQTNFTFAGVGNGNGAGFTNLQSTNMALNGTTNDLVTTNLLAGSPGYTNWQPYVNQGYMMYISNNLCISNLLGLQPNAMNWIHIALQVTNVSQTLILSWAPYAPGPCPILPAGVTNGMVLTNSQGYYQITGQIYGTNWATNAVWAISNPGL